MSRLPKIGLDLGACYFRALSEKDRRHQESGRIEAALKTGRVLFPPLSPQAPAPLQTFPRTPVTGPVQGQEDLFVPIIARLIDRVAEPRAVFRPRLVFALRDSRMSSLAQGLREAALIAGAAEATALPSSLVASSAIGYGPSGLFLGMDMGWSQSDLVLRDRDQVHARTAIPIAGASFDRAIDQGLARDLGLFVSSATRFKLKSHALSHAHDSEKLLLVAGRQTSTGTADRASLETSRIASWLEPELDRLSEAIVRFLMDIPPPYSLFAQSDGIWIYGGTARMQGLTQALSDRLARPVRSAQDPSRVLLRGLGRIMSSL